MSEPTNEPMPEASAEPTPEATDETQVLLSLSAPWYLESYTVTAADGSKLVIDENGVRVDAPAAIAISENAAANGVTLKIGN
jgi:hypothetical protein